MRQIEECRYSQSDVSTRRSTHPPTSYGGPASHLYLDSAACAKYLGCSVSTRTVSHRLVAHGLHSQLPLKRPPLTVQHRRQCLEWCWTRAMWMTEWRNVMFSDESFFCLSNDSNHIRVWRRRGDRSNPAVTVERPIKRQRGIMVWGTIAYNSMSPLVRIQNSMTAQRYLDNVLRPASGSPLPSGAA